MKDPSAPEVKPIEPEPVTVDTQKSALLVLELSQYCADPEYFASPIVPGITKLLGKARAAGILIIFTIPHPFLGTSYGKVYSGFERKPSEPLFYPPAFDKFSDGKLRSLLNLYGVETLVMTGCKANMAILYTATRAVTEYNYKIVIPVDGIAVLTDYEKEYTLYQFQRFPAGFPESFTFTNLDMISFRS